MVDSTSMDLRGQTLPTIPTGDIAEKTELFKRVKIIPFEPNFDRDYVRMTATFPLEEIEKFRETIEETPEENITREMKMKDEMLMIVSRSKENLESLVPKHQNEST